MDYSHGRPSSKNVRCIAAIAFTTAMLGCGADGSLEAPTSPEISAIELPRTSIAPSVSGNGVSDGVTEIYVDSLSGEIRIQNAGGGNAIYLDYDDELLEELLSFVQATKIGDANYDAMAVLWPWENSGGEPERAYTPLRSDGTKTQAAGRTLVRRATSSGSLANSSQVLLEFTQLSSLNEWSPDCPSIAQAIGTHRLNHHQSRGSAFDQFRGVQGIPASRLVWRDGKPHVTLQDLRNLYATFGMVVAESVFKSLQLNIMRTMYNGHYCQQAITVGLPYPGSVHVSAGGGGGGTAYGCTLVTLMYEISFDGGLTWFPLPIQTYSCGPQMS